MNNIPTNFKSFEFIHLIIISYLIFGFSCIILDIQFPNWFFAFTLFFLFKWLFNYRKCTISYIEIKLRGVKKEDGYLYKLLNYIVDFRYDTNVYLVYIFMLMFIVYHGIKTNGLNIYFAKKTNLILFL